jgi:hypothetical protein
MKLQVPLHKKKEEKKKDPYKRKVLQVKWNLYNPKPNLTQKIKHNKSFMFWEHLLPRKAK